MIVVIQFVREVLACVIESLKSKCFAIKLKCVVGDPDRFWNIGENRCCTLYLTSVCRLYYWSKEGWVWVGFECMAVVRRIFV